MTSKSIGGAEALLRALTGMGVERIYASPGSDWAPVRERGLAAVAEGRLALIELVLKPV